tara:strand:+ start:889 stop:1521 length:633 start_codon:yes stop_codon:yes gene_type:complete
LQGKECKDTYNIVSFGKHGGCFYWSPEHFPSLQEIVDKYDLANSSCKGIHSLVGYRRQNDVFPLIIDMDYKPWKDNTKKLWENIDEPVYLPNELPTWTASTLKKLAEEYTGQRLPLVVTKALYDQHPAGKGHFSYHFHGPTWGIPWDVKDFPRNYLIQQALQTFELNRVKQCICPAECSNLKCGQLKIWSEVFDGSIYTPKKVAMRLWGL